MTTHPTTHTNACRAYAIGCAVENIRDAKLDPIVAAWAATADPVDEGDRYLSEGLASCLCGTDATWAASWVLLGLSALDEAAAKLVAPEAPTAYVVTNEARGIPRYVTTDRAAALTWAQARANEDLADRPGYATPHYVVTAWDGDESWTGAAHVYAKAAAK